MHSQFAVHKLNDTGLLRAHAIAEAFDDLLTSIECITIEGRELAIVRTKLEEACFYAKKAMATNLVNQQ